MTATRPPQVLKKPSEILNTSLSIQELVDRASVVVGHYWPMTTFVHHNPIASLETLPFYEAVKVAERFTGGRGYLANEKYRLLLNAGRIGRMQLDAAIQAIAKDQTVELGQRKISQFDVFRAHLLLGITAPADQTISALVDRNSKLKNSDLALLRDSAVKTGSSVPAASGLQIRKLAERISPDNQTPDESKRIGREITLLRWCDQALHKQFEWLVNKELIKWCEAFLDEGHAPLPMPYREKGFYAAWKALAALEWSPCGISNSGRKIEALPESAQEALLLHLDALGIPEELRQDYLSLELTSLCGWASFINWRQEHGSYPWQEAYPIDLLEYLAVRLFYEKEIVNQICKDELGVEGTFQTIVSHARLKQQAFDHEAKRLAAAWRLSVLAQALDLSAQDLEAASPEQLQQLLDWLEQFPESEHGKVWLTAHEACFQEDLVQKLQESAASPEIKSPKESARPISQSMYCIDVRSEAFRRNLESVGNHETIGFAGFFGIPMRSCALNQHHLTDQLPAIVQPKYEVHEVIRSDQTEALQRLNAGAGLIHTIQEMLHDMKSHVLTPYIMVESLGWLFGVQLFGRTLFPERYRKALALLSKKVAPPVGTKMAADRDENGFGLTIEEQCATIEGVLKTMGLTKNFARLVLVCGHTSKSDNNPYEAALNCGACGGNSGKPNARLLAAMANKAEVREHLARNGILVPSDTHFIGGVHNTTTDSVELFDLEDLPQTHRKDLEQVQADLTKAAVLTNIERCKKLPGAGNSVSAAAAVREIQRRAGDWSETRPEWGLAGNAAFIIGRRALTKNFDLKGRVFLNSHDYNLDPSGALLEGIMMGPMVVGQWINAEHYFSTTDTEVYGSGSKIYHNVVGRVGIMSGPQSDLRMGLAWQSMMNGEIPYHDPLRLTVVIEAPRQRILDIVERQPVLKQLCDNEWIHLFAVDHESDNGALYRYRPEHGFVNLD